MEYVNIFQGDFIMALNLFNTLARSFFPSGAQASATTQREIQQPPTMPLESTVRETEIKQLNAPEQITTAAATMPEVLKAETLAATNQSDKPRIIKLEIPESSLRLLFSTAKDLVKSLLLGNEDAYSTVKNFLLKNEDILKPVKNFLLQNEGIVKPILLNLSQENSKPANIQAAPNPAY